MQSDTSIMAKKPENRIPFVRSMRGLLLVWFLLLAIVPMAIVSVAFLARAQKELVNSAENKLVVVRNIQTTALKNQFQEWEAEILLVSQLDILKSDIVDLAAGFRFLGSKRLQSLYGKNSKLEDALDGSAYSAVHQAEHRFFKKLIAMQSYEDILLIDGEGNVFYTFNKDPIFGAALNTGSYSKTNLAALWNLLKDAKAQVVRTVDAALFEGQAALFMGTPVFQEDACLGYLVFRLPMQLISRRLEEREGMGRTGETYLVGPDHRMRSDAFNDLKNRNARSSLAGTVAANGINTQAVDAALKGRTGTTIIRDYRGHKVLSAFGPLALKDLNWVILAKIDVQEALAPVMAVRTITIGLALALALLALVLALFASGRLVRPIRNLTDWARRISAGELEMVDIKAPKNEIGLLNDSFREAVLSLQNAEETRNRQNWLKTGQAELDDCMRGEQALESLCSKVIIFVAEYLKGQVATFYLNDGQDLFKLKGTYAYKTRKNLSNVFQLGEGLVGQAALEKQSILLTSVPPDYIRITSALGEKEPHNILVMPLVFDEAVIGVIEIGSFSNFSEIQREFLEESAERIAIAMHTAMARHRLNEALETTQRQAEELQTQQEELKTTNEELEEQSRRLLASQEELRVQQEELQVTNEEIKEKNDLLERQKTEVETARRDIEIKAEELALASKYKSEFLANMSHELRTPLNSLLLLAQGLMQNKEGNLTTEQAEYARIIHGSGNDLLNLINEILDLSKIEAGRMDIHLGKMSVKELAQGVQASFDNMAHEKGLQLETVVGKQAPVQISSDVNRVNQVIRNLVSNAIKFTETGGVTVSFDSPRPGTDLSKSGLDAQACLAVQVKDTGIGITPEQQKIIFQAFQQADGSTARKYGGTGLGLSISRELAKLLGGEIQLQSEPGQGSVFTFYLPIEPDSPHDRTQSKKRPESAAAKKPLQSQIANRESQIPDDRDQINDDDRTILIVEDDLNFARILLSKCREKGFKGLVATTGEAGLELARQYLPGGVVLDIRLPGIDGWTVLSALKEDIRTRHIPVHIASVEADPVEAYRKGALGHVTKPLAQEDIDEIFKKLEHVSSDRPRRVLIVEDDAKVRRSTVKLIGDKNVTTHEVENGAQALAALRKERYDCVVLDLGLPDMNGNELLAQAAREGIDLPPVVVYTARDLSRAEEMELREHAESIVIKDVRSQERLLDEVSLFLHRIVSQMPEKQRNIIRDLHDTDAFLEGKKVLIVDDDMRTTFALSRCLSDRGMKTLKAENGQRALQILDQEPDMDLVLMDIMMPVMDGYQAIRKTRDQERFHKLPILALTAKAMPNDRQKCLEAGASDYLTKPVDEERLISMMRVWLYR